VDGMDEVDSVDGRGDGVGCSVCLKEKGRTRRFAPAKTGNSF
jgi:hypothetical protein